MSLLCAVGYVGFSKSLAVAVAQALPFQGCLGSQRKPVAEDGIDARFEHLYLIKPSFLCCI